MRKERKVKKQLELEGWTVLRSAGSYGFADLVAINSELKIRFIQCKSDSFKEWEKRKLLEEHKIFNNPKFKWTTSFEVI